MSTTETTDTREEVSDSQATSYATRPFHRFSDVTTGWIKSQYGKRSSKGTVATLFFAVVVYAVLGGVVLYTISLTGLIGMNVVIFGGIISGVGFGAWSGYRAYRHIKQRRRVYSIRDNKSVAAGGEAMRYITSGDVETQKYATATVVDTVRNGSSGGVMKQSDIPAEEAISQLIELIKSPNRQVRLNASAALGVLALDYPKETHQHREIIFNAIRQRDTELQINALGILYSLIRGRTIEPSEQQEYFNSLETAIHDEDHRVRVKACIALGAIDGDRAKDLLKEAQNDSRGEVREHANEALKQRRKAEMNRPNASASTDDESDPDNDLIQEPPDMGFDDIAGMDELKTTLRDRVIDPFTGEDAYAELDVASESGILLYGPPGTGKTYIAECLAGELGINYLPAGVGSVESKYTGEGVENIREMFDQAHYSQPCLIFLDEFDALAGDRSDSTQQSNEQKQVNQLLQEFSDLESDDDILVIAATNNPDQIDDAMLRTGRFDSKIEVPKPDGEARWGIFDHHLTAEIETDDGTNIRDEFIRQTNGCTASDMERIAENTIRIAAKRQTETPKSGTETEDVSPLGEEDSGYADIGEDADGGEGEPSTPTIQWRDVEQAIEEVTSEQGNVGQFTQQPPDMDFTDVAGMNALKDELQENVIDPLESPELFEEFGVSVENGFMLYGPPGTGKTHIAKCLAGELGVTYIQADAGDLTSKWIGEGAKNVQQMFEEARQNQPSLVFIDEIDALATSRSQSQSKSERQMVNQFLDEISTNHDEDADVIVIGATNRLNDVDDALIRSGRLSEKIEIPPPDAEARAGIFEQHLDAPQEDLNRERIAALTDGFVASDMERLAETAARNALKRTRESGEKTPVSQSDVEDAITHIKNRQ